MRRKAGVIAVVALLAGCGGAQPPIGDAARTPAATAHADRGKSWMLPGATTIRELLYAGSDDQVEVYDYQSGAQVGMLTGLNNTLGECAYNVHRLCGRSPRVRARRRQRD